MCERCEMCEGCVRCERCDQSGSHVRASVSGLSTWGRFWRYSNCRPIGRLRDRIFVCDRIDKNVNQPWEGVPGLISDDEEEHY